MTDSGPYLYDEGPEPLHTGAPRRHNGLILAVLAGTVILAIASALLLPLVKGSPGDQARQAAGVFLAALRQGDTETARDLLCDAERARLTVGRIAPEYLRAGTPHVVGATERRVGGDPVVVVAVRWDGDGESRLTVINEAGPHVCGTTDG